MKTIETQADENALPLDAVILLPDGIAAQLDMHSGTITAPEHRGKRFWRLTNSTYVDSPLPERLLPARLLHPMIFTEADIEKAAKAWFTEQARQAAILIGLDKPVTWEDCAPDDQDRMLNSARAVLATIGEIK